MIYIYIFLGLFVAGMICYACCVISSDADRAAERYYDAHFKND